MSGRLRVSGPIQGLAVAAVIGLGLSLFGAANAATPPGDPVTQIVFAAPMIGLYALGIAIAWMVGPKHLRE